MVRLPAAPGSNSVSTSEALPGNTVIKVTSQGKQLSVSSLSRFSLRTNLFPHPHNQYLWMKKFGSVPAQCSSSSSSSLALWSRIIKKPDWATRLFIPSFARSLAPLTGSLAPDCPLHSHPLLHSLVCSLAHFAHSLARGKVNY